MLHACQNCWFNGLQYGPLGLPVGYCVRHRTILRRPDQSTCGQHLRKDLALARALEVSKWHAERYPATAVVSIHGGAVDAGAVSSDEKDLLVLKEDAVADVVSDYGELGATIDSLAQLRRLPGARAEVAMMSLGRGYVNNCVRNHGSWTSGLHLFWWTKRRLVSTPEIGTSDLLWIGGIPLARHVKLTAWSVMMLRLTLIDDIAQYAATQHEPLVGGLLQQAASAAPNFDIRRLSAWLKIKALPQLDRALPQERYTELARQLHRGGNDPLPDVVPSATPGIPRRSHET